MILAAMVLTAGFAASAKTKNMQISGEEAVKKIQQSFLADGYEGYNDSSEHGEDCTVSLKSQDDGVDVVVTSGGQVVSVLPFKNDKEYWYQYKEDNDGSFVMELARYSEKQILTLLSADDAYMTVTTEKFMTKVKCQVDF